MSVVRFLRYMGGVDIFESGQMKESIVYLEHGLDPKDSLPLDAGLKGAAEVYSARFSTIFKHAGAVSIRAIGLDAAYRIATGTEFPK